MSKQGNLGRPWMPNEDKLLSDAVHIHGENTEKWKTIALSVPGRTNKACRKRWLHSLSPTIKKCAWTPEEDRLLLSLFEKHPNRWSQIARGISGRTDDACSKRYREALDPNLKKGEWTEEEDKRLLDILARHGGPTNPRWGLVGQELRRSGLGCRNRWRLLERKKNTTGRQTSQPCNDNTSTIPHFLAEVLPLFAQGEPSTYWNSLWDPSNLVASGPETQEEPGLGTTIEDLGQMQTNHAHSMTMDPDLTGSYPIIVYDPGAGPAVDQIPTSQFQTTAPFLYASSSLSAALSDIRSGRHEPPMRPSASSTHDNDGFDLTQYNEQLRHDVNVSLDLHSYNNVVFQDAQFETADPSEISVNTSSIDTNNDQATSSSCADLCRSSLHAHTGLPLSSASSSSPDTFTTPFAPPAPQSQQVNHDLLPPPRKQRRMVKDNPASFGMRIVAIQVGKQKTPPKLSSTLPVAGDPSVSAYVCGHTSCWPAGSTSSNVCFATSGELWNHFKDQHMDDPSACNGTPFRCGLKGCNKGWKSINGLQYHLQISKAHYQRVFSTATSAKKDRAEANTSLKSPEPGETALSPPEEAPPKPRKKLHKCPYTDCPNEYKQMSGLRYHLLHGHPKNPPAQLDAVPPTIARKLGVETQTNPIYL